MTPPGFAPPQFAPAHSSYHSQPASHLEAPAPELGQMSATEEWVVIGVVGAAGLALVGVLIYSMTD